MLLFLCVILVSIYFSDILTEFKKKFYLGNFFKANNLYTFSGYYCFVSCLKRFFLFCGILLYVLSLVLELHSYI